MAQVRAVDRRQGTVCFAWETDIIRTCAGLNGPAMTLGILRQFFGPAGG